MIITVYISALTWGNHDAGVRHNNVYNYLHIVAQLYNYGSKTTMHIFGKLYLVNILASSIDRNVDLTCTFEIPHFRAILLAL